MMLMLLLMPRRHFTLRDIAIALFRLFLHSGHGVTLDDAMF